MYDEKIFEQHNSLAKIKVFSLDSYVSSVYTLTVFGCH